jgi:hypothetical protein
VVVVVVFVIVSDITQYYVSAVIVLMFLSVTAVTAIDFWLMCFAICITIDPASQILSSPH